MKHPNIPIIFLAAAISAPTLAVAEEEQEFEEAFLYFELNDTDGDLGLHGKVDGDGWKKVKIEGPNDRKILDLKVKSGLKQQGMTELFFESSEPTFDELDPEVFFPRFPEGAYEWEGKTLDNEEIEGEVWLSHIIPAAPVVTGVGDLGEGDNPGFEIEIDDQGEEELVKACWGEVDTAGGVTIVWEAVEESHYTKWSNPANEPLENEEKIPLGDPGTFTEDDITYYEFVAEVDDTDHKMTAVLPSDVTQWTIPTEFLALAEDGEVKFEIIVRVETGEHEEMDDDGIEIVDSRPGNQTAVEDCFEFEI